jgi:hypothetical protein
MGKSKEKWADANPFETLNKEVGVSGFLKKTSKALEEGWTFQEKKKHKVNKATTRLATAHLSQLVVLLVKVLGEKKSQKQSEFHHSFES